MRKTRSKSKILIIVFTMWLILSFAYIANTANTKGKKKEVRCHRCKEKNIQLVFKHRQIGYDGCFVCHGYLLKKKKPKKTVTK